MKSCVEPFDFETISFENALVIEATITNEFRHQEINLTRTFQFEEDAPSGESNANVIVTDDLLNTFTFEETTLGKYVSITEFSAEPNRIYELSITTQNGSTYSSQPIELPQVAQVDNLMAIREVNTDGIDGVTIYANSFDHTGNSRFYRYEFEETYKIIAILWSPFDALIVSENPPSVTTTPRIQEERICFNTIRNNEIILTQTTSLLEDRVSQFPIQFIASTNPILRERYSILVRQYVQSLEAFNYYKVLSELSGNESLLSQNQPGFINSNISSIDNRDEKVLGFFEIASVSSKQLFFNFFDIFPDINRPFYFTECVLDSPRLVSEADPTISPLINLIKTNEYKYFAINEEPNENLPGPYLMIQRPCGDCTALGTNIRPDFWID